MRKWIGIAGALALAACSGEEAGGDGNKATETKAGGGGSAELLMQAGQWELTTAVTRLSVAGMPAGMSPPTPAPETERRCLTSEEAAQASERFARGMAGRDDACTSESSSMSGGRIEARIQCSRPDVQSRATVTGQYTATTLDMTIQIRTTAAGGNSEMDARMTGRRIGDCPAGAR